MKKSVLLPLLVALAGLLVIAPVVHAAGASVTASASVNVKLSPAPGGLYLVGKPAVPIVSPHRITLGLVRAGVVRTRVFGLGVGRVVFVGARARPFVLVGSPVAVVNAPGVVVGSPGVVVQQPGVVVQQPGVVVQQPGVVVGAPAVVVGAPGVVVGAPGVVVGAPGVVVHQPGVVVAAPAVVARPSVVVVGGKHDNGHHNGHHKGGGKHGKH